MKEKIDENFVAYIKEAQQGILYDGRCIFCQNGKIIGAGSEESMKSLYENTDSSSKAVFEVDLEFAMTQDLKKLEKMISRS